MAGRAFARLAQHFVLLEVNTKNASNGMCSRLFLKSNKAYVLFLSPKGMEICRGIESPRMRKNRRTSIQAGYVLERMRRYAKGTHSGLRGAKLLESLRKADDPFENADAEHWLKLFAKHGKEAQYWLANETPKNVKASVSQLIWALAHKDLSPYAIKMLAVYGARAQRSIRYLLKKLEQEDPESYLIARVLPDVDPDGSRAIPALISCLSSGKRRVLNETLISLASYGQKAKAAIPAIQKLMQQKKHAVQSLAKKTLRAIEPKKKL